MDGLSTVNTSELVFPRRIKRAHNTLSLRIKKSKIQRPHHLARNFERKATWPHLLGNLDRGQKLNYKTFIIQEREIVESWDGQRSKIKKSCREDFLSRKIMLYITSCLPRWKIGQYILASLLDEFGSDSWTICIQSIKMSLIQHKGSLSFPWWVKYPKRSLKLNPTLSPQKA